MPGRKRCYEQLTGDPAGPMLRHSAEKPGMGIAVVLFSPDGRRVLTGLITTPGGRKHRKKLDQRDGHRFKRMQYAGESTP